MRKIFWMLILVSGVGFAQGSADLYFDTDGKQIDGKKFGKLKIDYREFITSETQTDSGIVHKVEPRITRGKLSGEELLSIQGFLRSAPEKILVIDYYQGKDKYNSSGDKSMRDAKTARYLESLKRFPNVEQRFVFASETGLDNWLPAGTKATKDNGSIMSKFFVSRYPSGSYIIMEPDGNYLFYKGEYMVEDIIAYLEKRQ